MGHRMGPEFLNIWDNPEEYITLVFGQLGQDFTIKVVVEAPGCPELTLEMAPVTAGRA